MELSHWLGATITPRGSENSTPSTNRIRRKLHCLFISVFQPAEKVTPGVVVFFDQLLGDLESSAPTSWTTARYIKELDNLMIVLLH